MIVMEGLNITLKGQICAAGKAHGLLIVMQLGHGRAFISSHLADMLWRRLQAGPAHAISSLVHSAALYSIDRHRRSGTASFSTTSRLRDLRPAANS